MHVTSFALESNNSAFLKI